MAQRRETSNSSDILLYVLAVFVPPLALALRMSSPEISGCDIIINVSATAGTENGGEMPVFTNTSLLGPFLLFFLHSH